MFIYMPSTAPVVLTAAQKASSGFQTGYALRGVHFWAAQTVLLVVLGHFVWVLTAHVYRPLTARKIAGLLATVVLTGLLWFTGILLPWDQLAYWLARFSAEYGVHLTLLGVYKAHIIVLPIVLAMTLAVYFRALGRANT